MKGGQVNGVYHKHFKVIQAVGPGEGVKQGNVWDGLGGLGEGKKRMDERKGNGNLRFGFMSFANKNRGS